MRNLGILYCLTLFKPSGRKTMVVFFKAKIDSQIDSENRKEYVMFSNSKMHWILRHYLRQLAQIILWCQQLSSCNFPFYSSWLKKFEILFAKESLIPGTWARSSAVALETASILPKYCKRTFFL